MENAHPVLCSQTLFPSQSWHERKVFPFKITCTKPTMVDAPETRWLGFDMIAEQRAARLPLAAQRAWGT